MRRSTFVLLSLGLATQTVQAAGVSRYNCFVDNVAMTLKFQGLSYSSVYVVVDSRNICQQLELAANVEGGFGLIWSHEATGATTPRQGKQRLVDACLARASVGLPENSQYPRNYCAYHRRGYALSATSPWPATYVDSLAEAAINDEVERYSNNLSYCKALVSEAAQCEEYQVEGREAN